MVAVTKSLSSEARSIFEDLGYSVSGTGPEFRATRAWKAVRVTAVDDPADPPVDGGHLQCYVTRKDEVAEFARAVERTDPACEWAVIGVADDGSYEVARAPAACE